MAAPRTPGVRPADFTYISTLLCLFNFPRPDLNLGCQRPVDRTFVGNFHQLGSLLGAQRTGKTDVSLNLVQHPFPGLAIGTILGINFVVAKVNGNAVERPALPAGSEEHTS